MSAVKPAEKIREEIAKRYNKNPEGWCVFFGKDSENYLSSLFFHDDKAWMIKEFAVNPFKFVGFGSKTCAEERIKSSPFSFGLRPISGEDEKALLSGKFSTIQEILSKQPVSFEECKNSMLVEGPIFGCDSTLNISKAQEELDLKLRSSLRKLLRRDYSDFLKPYV